MNPPVVSHSQRRKPQPIEVLVAQLVFLFGFQTGLKQLQAVFPSSFRFYFKMNLIRAMPITLAYVNRDLLTAKGRLCTMLVQRLLSMKGQFVGKDLLKIACFILMRLRMVIKKKKATCVATL